MPVTNGPQIDLGQIHAEAGGTATAQSALNDADIRALIGKASGTQMGMTEWYGAKAPIVYLGSTSTLQGGSNDDGVFSISLTSLGLQQGDMVIVACAQEGPGSGSTRGHTTSGWTQQTPNTYQTSTSPGTAAYYKVMGASPDTSFGWTTGSYYFDLPMVAVAFRNVGTRTAQSISRTTYEQSVNIPTLTVANAGSVSILTTTRGGNNAKDDGTSSLNTPSGYTKAVTRYSINAGIGYNWQQAVDIFYKLNCPAGSLNPGTHSWYFLGDTIVNHSIFY